MIATNIYATLQFQQFESIGKGGMSEVFRVHDVQIDGDLAIKKIPKANFSNIDEYFAECQKLYLSRHHNIVKIHYGCQDKDFIYLAMPLYKNGSIKKIIGSRFLSVREIVRYSLHFLSGLNNIHAKKLVHCDVKCANILIDDKDVASLCDFGLAKYMSRYGFVAEVSTTPQLVPPEFYSQTEHNLLFDIYQAGLALYTMCSGNRIFMEQYLTASNNDENKHDDAIFRESVIKGLFPDRKFWWEHIPNSLRNVIKKAIKPDPDNRYNSLIDMMNDLSVVEANDWAFSTEYSRHFEWNCHGYSVIATLEDDGTYTVVSRKGGKKTSKYCDERLSDSDKKKLLYTCLNDQNW